MSRELELAVAFVVGATGSYLWNRWRKRVLDELRRIRELLERDRGP